MEQTINTALAHHQAGRLEEAERLYREILHTHPDLPDALHLLGVLHHQRGNHDEAIALIRRAIQSRATSAMQSNLGLALKATGLLDDAVVIPSSIIIGP